MTTAWDPNRADCSPPSGCRRCGADPVAPKRYYCSDECSEWCQENHFWGPAKYRVLHPTHVSRGGYIVSWGDQKYATCARAGAGACGHVRRISTKLEVNHIVPVNGEREAFGCSNHQDNLEPLCHGHHLEVTAEQRRAGLIGSPAQRARAIATPRLL